MNDFQNLGYSQNQGILKDQMTNKVVKKESQRGAWLAQLVEHGTLDLRVVRLSPALGVELT